MLNHRALSNCAPLAATHFRDCVRALKKLVKDHARLNIEPSKFRDAQTARSSCTRGHISRCRAGKAQPKRLVNSCRRVEWIAVNVWFEFPCLRVVVDAANNCQHGILQPFHFCTDAAVNVHTGSSTFLLNRPFPSARAPAHFHPRRLCRSIDLIRPNRLSTSRRRKWTRIEDTECCDLRVTRLKSRSR